LADLDRLFALPDTPPLSTAVVLPTVEAVCKGF